MHPETLPHQALTIFPTRGPWQNMPKYSSDCSSHHAKAAHETKSTHGTLLCRSTTSGMGSVAVLPKS